MMHYVTMPTRRQIMDKILFLYFLIQIPSTLFFDTQGVYPESWYPQMLKSMKQNYLEDFKDPFLANAWRHPWYLAVCLVEHFLEVPFFFFATYAYYNGARNKPWVLFPSILYSVHTITAICSVWLMALLEDFSKYEALAPSSLVERLKLCFAYSPFMICSLVCLCDSLFLFREMRQDKIK
ncbi:sigma intracellular receptor 2 [Aplysia californica]|uniref:Sigma intracellular receptor 2 n=1 Tax=Aplysia californica TaxID=6500 RepID=A0ABM1A200_APLCA|nr:sigma intracellular receptor 2 [Aplysia californica]